MTVDRDGGDDAATKLGTPVFRPLPARLQTAPSRSRPVIQPRFLRAGPARVNLGLTPSERGFAMHNGASPNTAGRLEDRRWAPRPGRGLRFARFVAAIQAAGALGPDPGAWGAIPPGDPPESEARGQAGLAEAPARFARPRRGDWASRVSLGQALGPPSLLRTAVLAAGAGIASVALIALIAPFELTGGQDRAQTSDLPTLADGLVRAPPTPDRYPPANGPTQETVRDPQLIANLPPDPPAATELVADGAATAIDLEPSGPPVEATPSVPAASAATGSVPSGSSVETAPPVRTAAAATGDLQPTRSSSAPEAPVPAVAAATGDLQPTRSSIAPEAPVPAVTAATGDLQPARSSSAPEAPVPAAAAASSDPAPARPGLEQLSAAAQQTPPRIDPGTAGLAAGSKFTAVEVRTAALTEPQAEDDDPLYELAHRLQQKGDVAQAIEAYRMAADANPQHAATYYDWGYLLQQQGDEEGARQKYLLTLRYAPRHAFAHYNLGYILQKHGDYAGAIKHYRAAIAANHSFFWSYYNLGYIQQKLGHYREALIDYRKSIEVDPKHALSYENIATILRYHRTD